MIPEIFIAAGQVEVRGLYGNVLVSLVQVSYCPGYHKMSTDEPAKMPAQTQGLTGTFSVKGGLAQMLKGGIIMDVVNEEQARVAEDAGACAVMALEKVPADIRRDGGVARMVDPKVSGLVI